MSTSIQFVQCQGSELFHLYFQNTKITLCVHQLLTIVTNITATDPRLVELGLLWSLQNGLTTNLNLQKKPEYQLCFGQTILLLSQMDMVELIAQLWDSNPMLMHWVSAEEQVCS